MFLKQLLTARLDGLQAETHQLSIQLEDEKSHRINLQALNEELVIKNRNQEEKINFLMVQSAKQQEEIRSLKNNNIYNKNIIKPDEPSMIPDDPSPRAPPSSCRQLSTIGHSLDGIYMVANPDSNKIEAIFCDFGTTRNIQSSLFTSSLILNQFRVKITLKYIV